MAQYVRHGYNTHRSVHSMWLGHKRLPHPENAMSMGRSVRGRSQKGGAPGGCRSAGVIHC